MSEQKPSPVHTNTFEDLSGVSTLLHRNPYDALIAACKDEPVRHIPTIPVVFTDISGQAEIQKKYALHRSARNAQQKSKLLDASFAGVSIDHVLQRLSDPSIEPGYVDPRHCLVFWGRPTQKVKDVIERVQKELSSVASSELCFVTDSCTVADSR
jgi:vesicle-fusing ATPase